MNLRVAVIALLVVCLSFSGCSQTAPHSGQDNGANEGQQVNGDSAPPVTPPDGSSETNGINTLTGLPVQDGENNLRPVAVVVDNIRASRPSSGLSGADIVFEAKVWEGVTRFVALYSDYGELPVVGPVREMYMPLVQCVFPIQPVFITDGISAPCIDFLEQNEYAPFVFDRRFEQSAVWDNETRLGEGMPLEHSRYTDASNLTDAIQRFGTDMLNPSGDIGFSFAEEWIEQPPNSSVAQEVRIVFSEDYITQFTFDETLIRYQMAQTDVEGSILGTIDEKTGSQISFDNVLILFADITEHEDAGNDVNHDLVAVQFEKGGDGYYCYGGNAVPINWQKGSEEQPFQLSSNGEELLLHSGTTYVAVVEHTAGFLLF